MILINDQTYLGDWTRDYCFMSHMKDKYDYMEAIPNMEIILLDPFNFNSNLFETAIFQLCCQHSTDWATGKPTIFESQN